jgi:hypothetical protein
VEAKGKYINTITYNPCLPLGAESVNPIGDLCQQIALMADTIMQMVLSGILYFPGVYILIKSAIKNQKYCPAAVS